MILQAIAKRHTLMGDLFYTEVRDGPSLWGGHRRIDALAVKPSWRHPCITGYEVKINRQDFERDNKWPAYRDMCHKLFFACPADLIQLDEIPGDIGLIWYNPEKHTILTKRKATFRDIETPGQMLYYLLISRTNSDRHPFFSNRREFFEAWLEDKEDRKKLGCYVSEKIAQEIDNLRRQVRQLTHELNISKEAVTELEQVKAVIRRLGLQSGYGWIDKLERALKDKVPPLLVESIGNIEREIQRLKTLL